jgi:hypothetical protein
VLLLLRAAGMYVLLLLLLLLLADENFCSASHAVRALKSTVLLAVVWNFPMLSTRFTCVEPLVLITLVHHQ